MFKRFFVQRCCNKMAHSWIYFALSKRYLCVWICHFSDRVFFCVGIDLIWIMYFALLGALSKKEKKKIQLHPTRIIRFSTGILIDLFIERKVWRTKLQTTTHNKEQTIELQKRL